MNTIRVAKTAVITGATAGVGREVALDLARRGWDLVLPVRSAQRGQRVAELARHLGAAQCTIIECDLSDQRAVRDLCRQLHDGRRLDLVANVAGLGSGRTPTLREQNETGTELRMATNALTPHMIARRLADHLTSQGRIVQVGSAGQAALDLDDLNFLRDYEGIEAYCRSKVALIMSAIELAAEGVPINVVHPAREMPTQMVFDGGFPIASTLDDGVLPVLRLALDSHIADIRGAYFDRFDRTSPHPQALDPAARQRVVAWMDHCIATATSRP